MMAKKKQPVFVSIGSNQGDSFEIIDNVITLIENSPLFENIRVSSFYITTPVGKVPQKNFLNCAIGFHTGLYPYELLTVLQHYETVFGRKRLIKWGPRTLDLDILFYGSQIISSRKLTVPHPELRNRGFVLKPLVEIAPNFIDPVSGKTVSQLFEHWNKTVKDQFIFFYPDETDRSEAI